MKFPFGIQKRKPELTDTMDLKYQVGQVWSYRTRPQEPESVLTIVKVENSPSYGNIIHISMANLKLKNPMTESGVQDFMPHVPVTEDSLESSELLFVRNADSLPDFQEGYLTWREAFLSERGGAFSIPVDEIVNCMEAAVAG